MAAPGLPVIPGYTLTRRIAFGSSGEVYEAVAPGGFLQKPSKSFRLIFPTRSAGANSKASG